MKNYNYNKFLQYPNIYLQYGNYDWHLEKTIKSLKRLLNSQLNIPIILNSYNLFRESFLLCQYMAQMTLCSKKTACNKCNDCISFLNKQHPRFLLIDSKDTTETVRCKLERLKLTMSDKKLHYIVIINSIENIHLFAQQSLLKYLEDKRLNVYYLIITKSIYLIPDTILSRCQTFNITFKKDFTDYLLNNWGKNKRILNKNIDYNSVLITLKLAQYSPELWYKFLNNEVLKNKIEPFIKQLLNNILTRDINAISKLIIGNNIEESIFNLGLYSYLLEDLEKFNTIKRVNVNYIYFKDILNNIPLEKIINLKMNFYIQWTYVLKTIEELKTQSNLNTTIIINKLLVTISSQWG